MKNKLVYTKKWMICFMGGILFFTFSSKSVMYILTPKVRVECVTRGIVTEQREVNDIETVYTEQQALKIPVEIEEGIYIEKLLLYEGKMVKEGEPLIIFNFEDCQSLKIKLQQQLAEVKKKRDLYMLQKQQIEESYREQLDELEQSKEFPPEMIMNEESLQKLKLQQDIKEQELEQIKQQLEVNETLYKEGIIAEKEIKLLQQKQKILMREIEVLKLEYIKNEDDQKEIYKKSNQQYIDKERKRVNKMKEIKRQMELKMLNLPLLEAIEVEEQKIQTKYSDLNQILETGQIVASKDGMIGEVNVKENTYYKGKETLAHFIPIDSSVKWRIPIDQAEVDFWKRADNIQLNIGKQEVPVRLLGIAKEKDEMNVYFEQIDQKSIKMGENAKLTATIQSDFYNAVIPNSALIGEKIFILREEDRGVWGTAYYVDEIQVKTGEASDEKVGITSGVDEGAKVVVYWDRGLTDKQKVMIEIP